MEYMSVKEFRELGLLQELNRQFLHPLGLALEVSIDDETGEEKFGRIWDDRKDPEGFLFNEIDPTKIDNYYQMQMEKLAVRSKHPECDEFGIQQLPLKV